jgi:putative endopeptidase
MLRVRHTRRRGAHGRKTRRCDAATDFYRQLNKKWLTKTQIPSTETRITQAYFIKEDIDRELAAVIHAEERRGTGVIADLLASWDLLASKEATGLTPLLQVALTMDTPVDISQRIGWMNRAGIAAPLQLYIQGDPRDHSRCRVYIEEGQPRIGIPEYWLWSDYARHRKAYGIYVRRLAALLRLPALTYGYAAEREFANIYPSALERRSRIDMLTLAELQERYRVIDWRTMFIAFGIPEERLSTLRYNITSLPFLHRLQHRMTAWSIDRWRGWFALSVAQWAAGASPHGSLRDAWFAYNRRFLQGMPSDQTPQVLRCALIQAMLPDTLGRLWVRDHCSPRLRTDVLKMAERIRDAAADSIQKTSWMAPSTRHMAVRKLRAMDLQICWPDPWPESHLPETAMARDNYYGNLLALAGYSVDQNLDLLTRTKREKGCRSPTGELWGQPVFTVNAFYYPEENRLLLPAAILRPPFYDPAASVLVNYGAIGATIGHELCHGFDSDGRSYDEKGDKHDWWTEADTRHYKARAAQVVRLYESRLYRGMEVDGSLTLTENIADLGGLEFALAGARAELGRDMTAAETREFFESFAISWRSKDRKRRAAELLATDSHAPPMMRVNHAVRQFDEWYEAFGVGPECPDYVPPERRIRFFR